MKKLKKAYELSHFGNNSDCIIFANGPSLKTSLAKSEVLDFIKDKKKFCVNNFPNSNEFFTLKPEFIVFMDPFFWSKNLYPEKKTSYMEIYNSILKVNWPVTIFIPAAAKEWNFFIDLPTKNNNISIFYINTRETNHEKGSKKAFEEYKFNLAMPRVQNVTIASLFIAINSGFKNIYLFGADHTTHNSTIVKDDNILYEAKSYFYENEKQIKYVPCYKSADAKETFSVSEWLYAWYTTFLTYEEVDKYAKSMECKIYNLSEESFIDAFERKKIKLENKECTF